MDGWLSVLGYLLPAAAVRLHLGETVTGTAAYRVCGLFLSHPSFSPRSIVLPPPWGIALLSPFFLSRTFTFSLPTPLSASPEPREALRRLPDIGIAIPREVFEGRAPVGLSRQVRPC